MKKELVGFVLSTKINYSDLIYLFDLVGFGNVRSILIGS